MNTADSKKRKIINLCFFFAVFFAALGLVQFILGRNASSNAQIIMAIVTWGYSAILLISGAVALAKMKKPAEKYRDDVPAEPDSQPVQPVSSESVRREDAHERLKLEEIAARLKNYSEYADRLESGTAAVASAGNAVFDLGVMIENARRMQKEYSDIADAAVRDQETAFNDASDAYVALDDRKMRLKKLTMSGAAQEEIASAQEALSQANKAAIRYDEKRNSLQRRENKAKRLAAQAGQYAVDCEALRSRIERYS